MVTHDQSLAAQSKRNIHILDGRISSESTREPIKTATAA
jgi:predicted ABC-type transport system involved in lysophospholipase L1 biosynthesis ATPase subunit